MASICHFGRERHHFYPKTGCHFSEMMRLFFAHHFRPKTGCHFSEMMLTIPTQPNRRSSPKDRCDRSVHDPRRRVRDITVSERASR
jgi:hypothetical protein